MHSTAQEDRAHATDADAMAVALTARDLVKHYGEGQARITALAGMSATFRTREFTAIMGPSGSGKSTLLYCLAGLEIPSGGSVTLGDVDLVSLSDAERTRLRRTRLGFVFQAYNLVPALTARENILLPLMLARARVDQAWFDRVVSTLGIEDRLAHRPREMSGGEQQRIAVARALITRPDVVFADEPTGNLDSRSGRDLLELLRRTVDEFDETVVMVTHDPVAATWADRVLFLADGALVAEVHDPTLDTVVEQIRLAGAVDTRPEP